MELEIEPQAPRKLGTCSLSASDPENFEGRLRLNNPRLGGKWGCTHQRRGATAPLGGSRGCLSGPAPEFWLSGTCTCHARTQRSGCSRIPPSSSLWPERGNTEWGAEESLGAGALEAGLPPLLARLVACCGNYREMRLQSSGLRAIIIKEELRIYPGPQAFQQQRAPHYRPRAPDESTPNLGQAECLGPPDTAQCRSRGMYVHPDKAVRDDAGHKAQPRGGSSLPPEVSTRA